MYEVYQNSKPSDYKDNLDYLAAMLKNDTDENKKENDKKTKEYAEKLKEDEKLFRDVEASADKNNKFKVMSLDHEAQRLLDDNTALEDRIRQRVEFNNNMLNKYNKEIQGYGAKLENLQLKQYVNELPHLNQKILTSGLVNK